MKKYGFLLLTFLVIQLCFQQCANPGRPTGGPKDTIPPTLTYADPESGTTNFKGQTITLEFSEYINTDKLKEQLTITPKSKIQYKSIPKRNKLVIKLSDKLEDSTTYNFNFAEGVTDITEKNPVINLSIAFSTGPFIDSLSVEGKVEGLLDQKPSEGYLVGLYPASDTLDYFKHNPMYFTTANDSGTYSLQYIKQGTYKILAFNDENKNQLLDPETESHGFLSEEIKLDSSILLPNIKCILQNIKPLKLINYRSVGSYVEAKFNKMITSYEFSENSIYHNIIGDDQDIIRLYKSEEIVHGDSITTILHVEDSIDNQIIDTLTFAFRESNRKPYSLSYSAKEKSLTLTENPELNLTFNKPIITFDTSKIYIKADSTFTYKTNFKHNWNHNKTKLQIQFELNPELLLKKLEESIPEDTISTDSTKQEERPKKTPEVNLDRGTFVSIENDTSEVKSLVIKEPAEKSSGVLNITLNTEISDFTIQLISTSDEVMYEEKNQKKVSFNSVSPDTYKIRILIDDNQDGKWSYGNLLKNEEPETVYIHPEETVIRENWVIDLNIDM